MGNKSGKFDVPHTVETKDLNSVDVNHVEKVEVAEPAVHMVDGVVTTTPDFPNIDECVEPPSVEESKMENGHAEGIMADEPVVNGSLVADESAGEKHEKGRRSSNPISWLKRRLSKKSSKTCCDEKSKLNSSVEVTPENDVSNVQDSVVEDVLATETTTHTEELDISSDVQPVVVTEVHNVDESTTETQDSLLEQIEKSTDSFMEEKRNISIEEIEERLEKLEVDRDHSVSITENTFAVKMNGDSELHDDEDTIPAEEGNRTISLTEEFFNPKLVMSNGISHDETHVLNGIKESAEELLLNGHLNHSSAMEN